MNHRRKLDLDQVLAAYLAEGPGSAPDRVLYDALDQVATARQRRPLVPAWRPKVSTTARLALAAVLLIGLVAAGAFYVGNQPVVPVPTATATTNPTPVPTATDAATSTPAPTPTPTPAISALRLAGSALNQVDKAVTAAKKPLGIDDADQSVLLQWVEKVRASVDTGDLAGAMVAYQTLSEKVDARLAKIEEVARARLANTTASLGRMLVAVPFAPSALPAGTYYSATFTPVVAVTLPAGWSRNIEDAEVLVLTKGNLHLAFSHMAASVSSDAIASDAGSQPATLGRFQGFSGIRLGVPARTTLWFTEGLQAYDAASGSDVHEWVVDVGGRALTIDLDGPPAELNAALAEVEAILATLDSL